MLKRRMFTKIYTRDLWITKYFAYFCSKITDLNKNIEL